MNWASPSGRRSASCAEFFKTPQNRHVSARNCELVRPLRSRACAIAIDRAVAGGVFTEYPSRQDQRSTRRGTRRMAPPDLDRKSALFLDLDGTLLEIAATPELVVVPPALPAVLAHLHHQLAGAVAIVSGRPIGQIDRLLTPFLASAAGERERAVAGGGDFPGEQMDVVDEVVAPDAAGVLVEAHGPEASDLDLRVGIELGQRLEAVERHAGHLRGLRQRVVGDELRELVEAHVGGVIGFCGTRRLLLQRVFRTQAVADVGLAALEHGMRGDEPLVDPAGLDDVVGDGVEDVEVGLWCEHHADIGEVESKT